MMKQERFKIGDKVYWEGGPNEFRDYRYGTILSIKDNIATVDDPRSNTRTRQVPIQILKHK